MSEYTAINIDEISDIGARVPDGTYTFVLSDAVAKMSKAKDPNPMVVASYEVLSGEWEGFEIPKFYVLNVTRKNGKIFAGGLMELKKDLATAGRPLPKGYTFTAKSDGKLDAEEAVGLLKKGMRSVRFKGVLRSEVSKADGKTYGRLDITGIAGAGKVSDEFDQLFDGGDFDTTADEWESVSA